MNQPTEKQFLVISRGQWDEKATPEQVQGAIDEFYRWYERSLEAGKMKPGSRLARPGKVVSRAGIIDGPFAEAKELVGGFWFIMARSLHEAAELAAENPCLAFGLTVEVRELDESRAVANTVTNETPPAWRSR